VLSVCYGQIQAIKYFGQTLRMVIEGEYQAYLISLVKAYILFSMKVINVLICSVMGIRKSSFR
jgi:hypothetical protein